MLGGAWVVYALISQHSSFTICLFKRMYGIPCPSCGSTRCLMRLMKGDLSGLWEANPLGAFLGVAGVLATICLLFDLIRGTSHLQQVYRIMERMAVRWKWIFIVLLLLNWFWNIYKDL